MTEITKEYLETRFPHRIDLDRSYYSRNPEIWTWLRETFGTMWDGDAVWYGDSVFGYHHFHFQNEADLTKFKEWLKI